ncbi:GPI anchored CFEM domain protein C [Paramyrothecium foliicola]|nr:GPI anchored CFEM domain protein C [Paramyrothecium foliicola]
MQSIFSLALLVGLVAAQADGIPACARECVTSYTSGDRIAGCTSFDVKCICSNNDDFLSGIACCLEDACDQAGKDAAVTYAKEICSGSGVEVPSEVVCQSAASSSASSAPATTSGTATPAAETSTSSGTPTETAANETESPGAASSLQVGGGLFGAAVAMLMAL